MKIAVTYDNGNIFQHFGKTENFKVYEVEDNQVVSSEVIGSNGTGHGADVYKRQEYTCDGDTPISIPLVVLVNENTASAAEIFTGAVKDYGIGTIVGTTTFGKGIVQNTFQLSDGSVVKLTIAHYYTPLGNDIHKVGITPDVEVELPDDATSDVQLEKALEVVKGLESAE